MKTAMNGCTWGGYADYAGEPNDADRFFADVAEAGFEGIEVGGGKAFLGTPAACRKRAERHGLEIAAAGAAVTYQPYPPNIRQYRAAMRYAAELGVSTLMVCGGFMPWKRRNTYARDYDTFAESLGEAMAFAESLGLIVAYHPHRGCIVETIAETRQMTRRLPDLRLCVDVAHLEASGEDALKFIRTFRRQIVYTHIKDYSHKRDSFIELGKGDGKLDVAACVAELARVGYDGWLCVELDRPVREFERTGRTPLDSAKICRRYLRHKCGT